MTDPINALAITDKLFFDQPNSQLDRNRAEQLVNQTLNSMDDGELFLEYRESEVISLDDQADRKSVV